MFRSRDVYLIQKNANRITFRASTVHSHRHLQLLLTTLSSQMESPALKAVLSTLQQSCTIQLQTISGIAPASANSLDLLSRHSSRHLSPQPTSTLNPFFTPPVPRQIPQRQDPVRKELTAFVSHAHSAILRNKTPK